MRYISRVRNGAVVVLAGCSQAHAMMTTQTTRRDSLKAHDRALALAGAAPEAPAVSVEAHNLRQTAVFDAAAEHFASADATTDDVARTLDAIAEEVVQRAGAARPRVLDVGTGVGCLARRIAASGDVEVVGVDLSKEMIQRAAAASSDLENLSFWQGDILDYLKSEEERQFDVAVFNACFGNLHSPSAVMAEIEDSVRVGGSVMVTHPLGAAFVDQLRERDATVVPHSLPRSISAMRALTAGPEWRDSSLVAASLVERTPLDEEAGEDVYKVPYVATWKRRGYAPLKRCMVLSGAVARGYGRGSAKLGVPTANLPEDLFGETLTDVQTGVYCGWACVKEQVSRCVVNVGYSPTFAGEENKMKIVEANLMDHVGGDFYDEDLTILLAAFQRPERKFNGLPQLLEAIANDIETAKSALATPPLSKFASHPDLLNPKTPSKSFPFNGDDDDDETSS